MGSISPQNTEEHSLNNQPRFNPATESHTSTLSCSQSFSLSPSCINYTSGSNVSTSDGKSSTRSGVSSVSNVFSEQLSDSGIHSPLSISSDVAQFLEALSSPDAELSKSNSLSDSGLGSVIETTFTESDISKDNKEYIEDINRISSPSEVSRDHTEHDEDTCKKMSELSTAKRPDLSYVEMIAKCLVTSARGKVTLSEIYDYILAKYSYFETAPPAWRISVRHHLSTCEGFVKVGRVPLSRGFYWAAHPNCKQDFIDGIIEKKIMRKKIGNIKPRKRERKAVQKKQAPTETIEKKTDCCNLEEVVNKNNDLYRRLLEPQFSSPADRYDTVYNRLNSLSSDIPLSSTPIRSCVDYRSGLSTSFQSPVQTYGNPYPYNSVNSYHSNNPYIVQQNQYQQSWSEYGKSYANLAFTGYGSTTSDASKSVSQLNRNNSDYSSGYSYGQWYGTSTYDNAYSCQQAQGDQQSNYMDSSWCKQASLKTKGSSHVTTNSRYTPY